MRDVARIAVTHLHAEAQHQALAVPLSIKRAALLDEAHAEIERAETFGDVGGHKTLGIAFAESSSGAAWQRQAAAIASAASAHALLHQRECLARFIPQHADKIGGGHFADRNHALPGPER